MRTLARVSRNRCIRVGSPSASAPPLRMVRPGLAVAVGVEVGQRPVQHRLVPPAAAPPATPRCPPPTSRAATCPSAVAARVVVVAASSWSWCVVVVVVVVAGGVVAGATRSWWSSSAAPWWSSPTGAPSCVGRRRGPTAGATVVERPGRRGRRGAAGDGAWWWCVAPAVDRRRRGGRGVDRVDASVRRVGAGGRRCRRCRVGPTGRARVRRPRTPPARRSRPAPSWWSPRSPCSSRRAGGAVVLVAAEATAPMLAAAMPVTAATALAAGAAAVTTNDFGTIASCVIHDNGPIATRNLPNDRLRNARTTAGSNCVPAHLASSSRASTAERAALYERTEVITSNVSATDTMRAGQRDLGAATARPGSRDRPIVRGAATTASTLVAQPTRQWCRQLGAELGVQLDRLELFVGQLPRLVQDRRVDAQLADVVHQPGPSQPIELDAGEPHLLADHLRVGAHTFRVTAGEPVVVAQRADQFEQPLGGVRRFVGTRRCVLVEQLLQLRAPTRRGWPPCTATAPGRGTAGSGPAARPRAAAGA